MNILKMTIAGIVGLSVVAIAGVARGHNEPVQIRVNLTGGIVCDTLQLVESRIRAYPKRETSEGCGVLSSEGGTAKTVIVTHLPDFIHNGLIYHMAQYEFEGYVSWGKPVQFGFFGIELLDKVPTKPV